MLKIGHLYTGTRDNRNDVFPHTDDADASSSARLYNDMQKCKSFCIIILVLAALMWTVSVIMNNKKYGRITTTNVIVYAGKTTQLMSQILFSIITIFYRSGTNRFSLSWIIAVRMFSCRMTLPAKSSPHNEVCFANASTGSGASQIPCATYTISLSKYSVFFLQYK